MRTFIVLALAVTLASCVRFEPDVPVRLLPTDEQAFQSYARDLCAGKIDSAEFSLVVRSRFRVMESRREDELVERAYGF